MKPDGQPLSVNDGVANVHPDQIENAEYQNSSRNIKEEAKEGELHSSTK